MQTTNALHRSLFAVTCMFCSFISSNAQQGIFIDTAATYSSSVLTINSPNRGVLFPRISLVNVSESNPVSVTPAEGLIVYNTNPAVTGGNGTGYYYWQTLNGISQWVKMQSSDGSSWGLLGNTGTNASTHFIGTLDDKDFRMSLETGTIANIGKFNTGMGFNGAVESGGTGNTALGSTAMETNNPGGNNTAIGSEVLKIYTTCTYNVGIGRGAFFYTTKGSRNVAIGNYAGKSIVSDTNNVFIGNNSGGTFASYCTSVGNGAITTPNQASSIRYAVAIGDQSTSRDDGAMSVGDIGNNAVRVGIGLTSPMVDMDIRQNAGTFSTAGIKLTHSAGAYNYRMYVDAAWDFNWARNGVLRSYIEDATGMYTVSSDLRMKKDINDLKHVLPAVRQLMPKAYRYKDALDNSPLVFGFVAQDVEMLFPDFVTTHTEAGTKALSYQNFEVLAVQAIKEQQLMIDNNSKMIDDLYQRLEALEKK